MDVKRFVCLLVMQGSLQEVWFARGPSDAGVPCLEHGNVLLICRLDRFINALNCSGGCGSANQLITEHFFFA